MWASNPGDVFCKRNLGGCESSRDRRGTSASTPSASGDELLARAGLARRVK